MNKKLTAKLQKIQPDLPSSLKSFSGCFSIEPETKDLVLRKGVVYGVYQINSEIDLDVTLTAKIFVDVLHDSYFESDNISPIQSLEKALLTAKDKLSREESPFELVCTCSVLWGNVLYVVQMGEGETYLMRDGDTRKINVLKEGNFASTSGVIKADDVVILCTKDFAESYTPQKLLTTQVESRNLKLTESGLILKFIVDLSFTEDEVVEFSTPYAKKKTNVFADLLGRITALVPKKKKVAAVPTTQKDPVVLEQPIRPASKPTSTVPKVSLPQINIKLSKKVITALVVVLLLGISIIYSLNKSAEPISVEDSSTIATNTVVTPDPEPQPPEPEQPVIDEAKDTEEKTTRVSVDPFYDIKITDSNASGSEIITTGSNVYVIDTSAGRIYTSSLATPKFNALPNTFSGIKSLHINNDNLAFIDTEGYKVLGSENTVVQSYAQEDLGTTRSYLTNIYSVTGDTLNKYSTSNGSLTPTLWAESADFTNAKDMDIAISIFLVSGNGNLLKYTTGTKDTFSPIGVPTSFGALCCIWTDLDSDYLYVADPTNKRIVVLDKEGVYIKQYKHSKENDWSDIKDFYIDAVSNRGFLLNGSKVYIFNL